MFNAKSIPCLGIDPGSNGALALIAGRKILDVLRLKDKTGQEIKNWIRHQKTLHVNLIGAIEAVGSSPQMGVVSAFTFGKGYGHLIGMLDAFEIPYEFVRPQKWQKALGCLSKGDKNVTKAMAHRTWPAYKATHADADALLIALWLSRQVH